MKKNFISLILIVFFIPSIVFAGKSTSGGTFSAISKLYNKVLNAAKVEKQAVQNNIYFQFLDPLTDLNGNKIADFDEGLAHFEGYDIEPVGGSVGLYKYYIKHLRISRSIFFRLNQFAGLTSKFWKQMEIEEWPLCGDIGAVAYEDLPLHNCGVSNDYDYNDFAANVKVEIAKKDDGIHLVKWSINGTARCSGFNHSWDLYVPPDTFDSASKCQMFVYDYNGKLYKKANIYADANKPITIRILEDLYECYPKPPQGVPGHCINAWDGSGVHPGCSAIITCYFFHPIHLELKVFNFEDVGIHGEGLFFDLIMNVFNTLEKIGFGDLRTLVVPTDWVWPQEGAAIWKAYPSVETVYDKCGRAMPFFSDDEWYKAPPTDLIWNP